MSDTTDGGWVGVDLDGTLAFYGEWRGAGHIGEPVPLMAMRVKKWLSGGVKVKIFTARVSSNNPGREEALQAIKLWTLTHFGQEIPATAEKDFFMYELWDDRCVSVQKNTGVKLTVGE